MNATMTPPAESHDFFKKCWTTTLPILRAAGIAPGEVILTGYCKIHSALTGGLKVMLFDGSAGDTHVFYEDVKRWQDEICGLECQLSRCDKTVCTTLFNNRNELMHNELANVFSGAIACQ